MPRVERSQIEALGGISMGGKRLQSLGAPAAGSDAARLQDITAINYVEKPARVVATANVNTTAPGAEPTGLTLANEDRVFLTGQTTVSQNGLYTFAGAAVPLVRTADTFTAGSIVTVGGEDTANPHTLWLQTTKAPEVGVTALTFIDITPPSLTRQTETEFGDAVHSSFEFTHGLHSKKPAAFVVNNSTGAVEGCTVTYPSSAKVKVSAEGWESSVPASNAYTLVLVG
ncbi:MAG TPA: hypothetical protein VG815_02755 [Chloroflexota bacterium]|jgi:hypothetical protein|nr:hypothetical protein [Chloroflexota bacterium]